MGITPSNIHSWREPRSSTNDAIVKRTPSILRCPNNTWTSTRAPFATSSAAVGPQPLRDAAIFAEVSSERSCSSSTSCARSRRSAWRWGAKVQEASRASVGPRRRRQSGGFSETRCQLLKASRRVASTPFNRQIHNSEINDSSQRGPGWAHAYAAYAP